MSCKSRWTGPEDQQLETLLKASIERAKRENSRARAPFTVEFPPSSFDRQIGTRAAEGNDQTTVETPPSDIADILSPSRVNTYLDCSARWYYQKVLRLPDPSTGKQVRGRAVHALVGYYFKQRRAGYVPEQDALRDAYEEIWEFESADAVYSIRDNVDELKQSGAVLAWKYIHECGDKIKPSAIEMEVQGVIGGVNVRGRVDLLCATEDGRVIDLKVSGRSPSGVSAGHALQLATYARLTPGASGLVQLDTLVPNKTPKLVSIDYRIPEADVILTDRLYPRVQQYMRAGIYTPNRGSMFCSRANCSFADRCEQEFGGIVE
jgi:hypothetical protein